MSHTEPRPLSPHVALNPVRDETHRLQKAGEDGDYIAKRIRKTKRWIGIAATIGLVTPFIPAALFINEAYWFEWLFAYHTAAGGVGILGTLIGIGAPIWALIRIGFEVQFLNRYKRSQADHQAFLNSQNRCPLEFRTKRS